jgi:hypothetical protein
LSRDEDSVGRILLLVMGKKPEDLEEEEEISNEELLKELERRKNEGRISFNITSVSDEVNSLSDLDVDIKDNEGNCRINLKEEEREEKIKSNNNNQK